MARSARFTGHVDERGRLHVDRSGDMRRHLLALAGKEIGLTVGALEDERSSEANAYLWGVVYELMSEATGQDALSIHEAMKQRFMTHKVVSLTNAVTGECEEYDVVGSTRTSIRRFYYFVEQVRAFAGEWLGLVVPDPDKNWREKKRKRAA
jgi:hypothetical protein